MPQLKLRLIYGKLARTVFTQSYRQGRVVNAVKTHPLSKRQHGLITLHGVTTKRTITEVKLVYERCCRVKVGCLQSKLNQIVTTSA